MYDKLFWVMWWNPLPQPMPCRCEVSICPIPALYTSSTSSPSAAGGSDQLSLALHRLGVSLHTSLAPHQSTILSSSHGHSIISHHPKTEMSARPNRLPFITVCGCSVWLVVNLLWDTTACIWYNYLYRILSTVLLWFHVVPRHLRMYSSHKRKAYVSEVFLKEVIGYTGQGWDL